MSGTVRQQRGTTLEHSTYTGPEGQITIDTTKKTVVVHDGVTPGGIPVLNKLGGQLNGPVISFREKFAGVVTSNNLNLDLGNYFTKTISANTTLTLSNIPITEQVFSFMVEINLTGNFVVTWFNGVKWPGGLKPTLTVNGKDLLTFITRDGGVTWDGNKYSLDSK